MIVCSRNTGRESSHISFFDGGDTFLEEVRRPENTYDTFAWVTHRSLRSLEQPAGLSLSLEQTADLSLRLRDQQNSPLRLSDQRISPSVQNYRPYIVFSSPMRKYEHPLRLTYFFCLWMIIGTYILSFFLVICWFYLQTEISITLSIGTNYILAIVFYFSLSCETTLLMLSRNHNEVHRRQLS